MNYWSPDWIGGDEYLPDHHQDKVVGVPCTLHCTVRSQGVECPHISIRNERIQINTAIVAIGTAGWVVGGNRRQWLSLRVGRPPPSPHSPSHRLVSPGIVWYCLVLYGIASPSYCRPRQLSVQAILIMSISTKANPQYNNCKIATT